MLVTRIPPPLALVVGFAIVLGFPIGLYVLLTRGRRRAMREIRQGAEERGWRFKLRHWQGNPTAFGIAGATGSGLEFFQHAQEMPSGLAAFDAAYRVLVLTKQFSQPPVEATLAGHILHWPENTIAPHSVLAWRDAF